MTHESEPTSDSRDQDDFYDALFLASMEGYAQAYVREGRLDVSGLTDDALFMAVAQLLLDDLEADAGTEESLGSLFTLSFEESLLSEARRFDAQGNEELAVMMYATWFEHWLNAMFIWGVETRGLNRNDARDLIRSTSIVAKTGHVWHLVFGEQLEQSIAKAIQAVAARRNEFVHYKWTNAEEFTSRRGNQVATAEAAVAKCLETEDRLVYGGSREAIKQAIRNSLANFNPPR